ncbi:patatin-like phospholipase family protein [Flavobacterium columnare]|uniref:patatin-like phospholipase family protein n=1 Tax=Flavobacterium columnare TaxID=996 RepID=UPI000B5B7F2E|nr:patatin-like phospholipase family protein [Flavobacterium columnare]OXA83358.1 patatin [Flavobacterium columnare] [Flavobacterium columnare NBRC 100251 = ATCC 23463]
MSSKIRILSLDGGGIRGIITCVILKYIEEQLQKEDNPNAKIGNYFDLIAGSSTGGLLACFLLHPDNSNQALFSVNKAMDLYQKEGGKIFNTSFWEGIFNPFGLFNEKISQKNIEKELDIIFGKTELKKLIKPCLITSYDIHQRKAKFFCSHEAHTDLENFYVKDVCRATSAAPTYFEPAKIKSLYGQEFTLIDGGVYANNPALCAFAEASKIPFSKILNNPNKVDYPEVKDLIIVSIGTGEVLKPYAFEKFQEAGKIKWISPLIDILLSSNAETVNYHLSTMYQALGTRNRKNYYRLAPLLRNASPEMDNTTEKNIYELIQAGMYYVDQNREKLDEIVKKLVKNK